MSSLSRSRFSRIPRAFIVAVLSSALLASSSVTAQQNAPGQSSVLAEILLKKGVLTPEDMKQLDGAPAGQAEALLAHILMAKGVLSAAEYEQVAGRTPETTTVSASSSAAEDASRLSAAVAAVNSSSTSVSAPARPSVTNGSTPTQVMPAPRAAIAALTPVRMLPVGGVSRDSITPAFKANGVGYAPYGFIKATVIEDSSAPGADDFPLPGFLTDTGPDGAPEFHVKVRTSRVGFNLAWLDTNPKLNITGRVEMDFEGNFNKSDNRNISSIRSSNPSVRLAWGRVDYKFNDKNTISALFGQDWTPFASSTLPSILEATGYGVGFGILWERSPQIRVGYTHKVGGFQIMPEFAVAIPASGLVPSAANVAMQLGYGERQGPDANRPDLEGRIVGQWQLDHAPGVAPAQIIFSGERGARKAIVTAASVPAAYQKTFAAGATAGNHTDGWTAEWQLPTRYLTVMGKFYNGADLRYFFANQLYSYYNDTAGLTSLATAASIDGSSNVVFGTNAAGQQVVAPERPLRTDGGWMQVGLPLSRIFQARAAGRNAGWSLYALYGVDQAKTRDLNKLGGATRRYGTMAVGTLNYTLNRWVSFSFEQSLYTTHANPEQPLPLFKGVPSREWNDVREEFGPTFTF